MVADAAGKSQQSIRSKVLRAALAAIEELGPDRVRVKDIAERADMSAGHVLYYFGDRDRILVDTLLLSESDLADRRDRAVARAADPWVAVDKLSRLYLPTSARDIRWTLWAQVVARPPADTATRESLRAAVDEWSTALSSIIVAGVVSGEFRDVSRSDTAFRYCRFMDGVAMEVLLGSPSASRTWAVEQSAATWRSLVARD